MRLAPHPLLLALAWRLDPLRPLLEGDPLAGLLRSHDPGLDPRRGLDRRLLHLERLLPWLLELMRSRLGDGSLLGLALGDTSESLLFALTDLLARLLSLPRLLELLGLILLQLLELLGLRDGLWELPSLFRDPLRGSG